MGNCSSSAGAGAEPAAAAAKGGAAVSVAASAAAAAAAAAGPGGGSIARPATARPPDTARTRAQAKRIAVAAAAITDAADVRVPDVPKTTHALALLEAAAAGNPLFEPLSLPARAALFGSMAQQRTAPGEAVVVQGDTDATRYYAIERGEFDVYVRDAGAGDGDGDGDGADPRGRRVATLGPGAGFGELALLYDAPRAATVVSRGEGKLWAMERRVYGAVKATWAAQEAAARRALVDAAPLLAPLAPEHRAAVADALEVRELRAGDVVFRQGESGDAFYLVREGVISLTVDGAGEVARLEGGAHFGERALQGADPRAATATADAYTVLYRLSRRAFTELLGPIEEAWRYEALRGVPALAPLGESQLFALARAAAPAEFAPGAVVFAAGDAGDAFYVVTEGEFVVTSPAGAELARLRKGQCFGELALLSRAPRAATVAAAPGGARARALACSRADFDAHLGSLAEVRCMWRLEALAKVPLLAGLDRAQRLALAQALAPVEAAPGAAVVTAGEPGEHFFVVERGAVVVEGPDGEALARLGPGATFGERALLTTEPRAATVRAARDGGAALLRLGRADFAALLGPVQGALRAEAAAIAGAAGAAKLPPGSVRLSDLTTVATLGSGAFGHVTLVKLGGSCYALKALSKAHVVASGLAEHVKRERALMSELASPFITNLVTSFQDDTTLYMLLELVQGGELFAHLQARGGPLPEPEARFYAGCVVLGLEYMHDRGIAWRDLKPENLLLDTAGYLKLADFGFARRLGTAPRARTLCGTPEYLAPELVSQAGHGRGVDWWALGVLIFEMAAGHAPFCQADRVAMFRAIVAGAYEAPPHFSRELRDLVRRLLARAPARRLGCTQGGAAEVKRHPWFAGLDWGALAARRLRAPHVPAVAAPDDASCFDGGGAEPPKRGSRYVSTGVFADF